MGIKHIQNFQLRGNKFQWLIMINNSSPVVLWNKWHCERIADQPYLWNFQTWGSASFSDFRNSTLKSFQLILMSHWNHMDGILIVFFWRPNFPSFVYQKYIYKVIFQLKYFTASSLNTTLPEVTKLCALLLTFPTTNTPAEWSFSALKRVHNYLRNMQTQERLKSIMSSEEKILQDPEKVWTSMPLWYIFSLKNDFHEAEV